jgi:hypothetical protein
VSSPTTGAPDLGHVDQVLVAGTLRRIHDAVASRAVVVVMDLPPGEPLDDGMLMSRLAGVAQGLGEQALWSLCVTRTHAGNGSVVADSRAEVRLDVVAPSAQADSALLVLESLATSLPQPARAAAVSRGLGRDAAIASARDVVSSVWDVPADRLQVSDEQHHPQHGGWTIGLVDRGVARFEVDLAADGDPRTVRARRRAAAEVADSIGEFG